MRLSERKSNSKEEVRRTDNEARLRANRILNLIKRVQKHFADKERLFGNFVFTCPNSSAKARAITSALHGPDWKIKTVRLPGDRISRGHQKWIVVSEVVFVV